MENLDALKKENSVLRAENASKDEIIKKLEARVAELTANMAWLNRQLFVLISYYR